MDYLQQLQAGNSTPTVDYQPETRLFKDPKPRKHGDDATLPLYVTLQATATPVRERGTR